MTFKINNIDIKEIKYENIQITRVFKNYNQVFEDRKRNALEWLNAGYNTSGVYRIFPDGINPVDVYCDMVTNGGGWQLVKQFYKDNQSFDTCGSWSNKSIQTCHDLIYDQTYNTFNYSLESGEYMYSTTIVNNTGKSCTAELTDHLKIDGVVHNIIRRSTPSKYDIIKNYSTTSNHVFTFDGNNGNYIAGDCDDNPRFYDMYLYKRG